MNSLRQDKFFFSIKVVVGLIGLMAALITIAVFMVDIPDRINIEFQDSIEDPATAASPTLARKVVPTFTCTPTATHVPTGASSPTVIVEAATTPTPQPSFTIHYIRSREVLTCIAKHYYSYSDATAELCEYNKRHPESDLDPSDGNCSELQIGQKIVIPRYLLAIVTIDLETKAKEERQLAASGVPQPNNAILCLGN